MKKHFPITLALTITCLQSYAQITLKEIKFNSWFGYELNSQTETVYCLLGTGFFRAPRAHYTDSLISAWTNQHQDALVIPVYTSGPTRTGSTESKMIYAWVVDKSDTLNILLVRQGFVPGGTMQRAETWDEMSRKERRLWYDGKKPKETVHVDSKTYQDFLDKIVKAETEARMNKLGIWSEKKD